MGKETIADVVTRLVRAAVEEAGCTLWDVTYRKEGADRHLTVTIDKEGGVTLDDCERVHRAIDPLLDEADPIPDSYYLDVSSPGVERELRTEAHILASLGETVEARLFAPIDGKRAFRGTLVSFSDGALSLDTEAGAVRLPLSAVSRLKTVFFD